MSDVETGTCRLCDESYPLDGEQAVEHFGTVVCADCVDESVVFVAECSNQFCDWTHRVEDTEFNRGHVKTRAQQEANNHERWKRVFEDDPMHETTVREVDDE